MPITVSKIPAWGWYALAIAGALGLAFLARSIGGAFWLPLVAASALWGLICAGQAWTATDEPAREAHKSAVFWGGSFGTVVALLASFAPPVARSVIDIFPVAAAANGGDASTHIFGAGVMFAAGMSVVGYFIAWAGWWLAKR